MDKQFFGKKCFGHFKKIWTFISGQTIVFMVYLGR